MRSVSFVRAAVMSMALLAPVAALAQGAPAQQNNVSPQQTASVPQDEALQVQHQMGFSSGNDAAQGRYYDDNDQYIDPHTGKPYPGAPGIDNPINY